MPDVDVNYAFDFGSGPEHVDDAKSAREGLNKIFQEFGIISED